MIAEWDKVQRECPEYQAAFAALETEIIRKTNLEWAPRTCGFMLPRSNQYGRTTILPACFDGLATTMLPHWRQTMTSTGHQTIITGVRTGDLIPEDVKIAWLGLAFPNKQQHITEVRWQIGDRKYGRINLEDMRSYNKPALIFEDGFILDEETSFHLYAYIEGPIPTLAWGPTTPCIYQSVVMLGAMYYKNVDKVLGDTGAAIP